MEQDPPNDKTTRQQLFVGSSHSKLQYFTFNDVLISQNRNCIHETTRWLNAKLLKPGATIQ